MRFPQSPMRYSGLNGGRAIVTSKPMATVFAILSHCRNTTAGRNYFVRADGQLYCTDAMLGESIVLHGRNVKMFSQFIAFRLFPRWETGPYPLLPNGIAPTSFYLFLYGLVSAMLRFGKISRGGRRRGLEIGRFRLYVSSDQ